MTVARVTAPVFDLTGSIAPSTGSSRGTGRAHGLAGSGAIVVLHRLDAGHLERTRAD